MCGIAGIFSYHYAAPSVDREELRRIRDAMAARGPDGLGEWYSEDGRVGLGHRRLSIIDLSERAAQPMVSADGRLAVTFNGEIYNYRELRKKLQKEGNVFRTESDTEVLLHLYAQKGEAMVHDLRGMFAFALWDGRINKLFLVRDPYGIKPLYYADDGWTLRVASQVRALLAGGRVSRVPEPAGAAGFFLMGSIPEPFTLYQEIRQVPAGSTVWVDELGPAAPGRYFSLSEIFVQRDDGGGDVTDESGLQARVREAMLDSVRHHFVADVPVGIFLSAGIDSGTLVALAGDAGITNLKTLTLAFDEYRGRPNDESPLAEKVAGLYGTAHLTRTITREEFQNDLTGILEVMDQPTIDGINTYFVSKMAAQAGLKVVLSGVGGDELFGGYPGFEAIPRWVKLFAAPSRIPFLGDIFRRFSDLAFSDQRVFHPKLAGILKYGGNYPGAYFLRRCLFFPWELEFVLQRDFAREGLKRLAFLNQIKAQLIPDPRTSFGRVASMEAAFYLRNQLLRDTDWAGMAHSLEIRTPYVDVCLLKALGPSLAAQKGFSRKKVLAKSPRQPLPGDVVERKKTGFGVPIDTWLETQGRFDIWKKIPELNKPGCPWARRWAYNVYRLMAERN